MSEEAIIQAKILERFQWKKVEAPRTWRPSTVGEELVGFYGGRSVKNGQFGQYEVALVHIPLKGSVLVSGTGIMQLIDAALIQVGHPIHIVWGGLEKNGDRKFKKYSLHVAEGNPLEQAMISHLADMI